MIPLNAAYRSVDTDDNTEPLDGPERILTSLESRFGCWRERPACFCRASCDCDSIPRQFLSCRPIDIRKLVPEPGFEPGPPYGERILSPFVSIKSTTRHNSRQHATTLKPPCRRGLGAPSAVGRCCGELPDVGSKCPMSVPWVIRPLPFVRNPIDPASIQTPRVSTRQCRSSNPRKS